MFANINLDRFLSEADCETDPNKFFPNEIFMSHRQFDRPSKVIETLKSAGVGVIWDFDLDVRDRRVVHGISRAMQQSRYIALFVSNEYVDSPWCRAEYLNALWVTRRYKFIRAIVLLQSKRAEDRIPAELEAAPRFFLNKAGTASLIDYVLAGNLRQGNEEVERVLRTVPKDRLGQSMAELSTDEKLNLLSQRLAFWNEYGYEEIKTSNAELKTALLSQLMGQRISEPEIIFRDAASLIMRSNLEPVCREGIGTSELNRLTGMCEVVAAAYGDLRHANELAGFEEWKWDFLLKPLLFAVASDDTRRSASNAYRAICAAIQTPNICKEVSGYLATLADVEGGMKVSEAAELQAWRMMADHS